MDRIIYNTVSEAELNEHLHETLARKLPAEPIEFCDWSWAQIEPLFALLEGQSIDAENVTLWLTDWSHLSGLIYETYQRLYVAVTVNTNDPDAEARYNRYLDDIFVNAEAAEQKLGKKLLESGLQPAGFELPLRNIQAEVEIFSPANLPLLAEELKLSSKYDKIIGAQTVQWQTKEFTLIQLQSVQRQPERELREAAWRLEMRRWLEDRQAINALWTEMFTVRTRLAANLDLPDYRAYRWKKMLRFDYTPQDCAQFHAAIEKVVVPASRHLYERRRSKLGVDELHPWDLLVDPGSRPPLQPYEQIEQLEAGVARIFERVDPQLGEYFAIMRLENLLDLENRKGKAPGGYCTDFPVSQRPFILMNAVGIHDDVQTLLHEGGHAFHVFETNHLPYFQQKRIALEFAEVASIAMELLSAPYLPRGQGGFYTEADAARARIEFLESSILFWPYMAVVDGFQHWAYTHPSQAVDPAECDRQWDALWERFMTGVDWSELEVERTTGWQRKLHILQEPFYYVEYGLAQLGAFQIWQNALQDQAGAVAAYRRALALGGTAAVPQLFQAAGVRFAFDAETLQRAVDLGLRTIETLDSIA
ncbi:MAG: M3 family oligoendopeptidase [Anaerolineae bacterium UTCFX2]|jgi:oligoendopeptidase F|nr:MAG: M3 family oligoendopeptidase [Anaerolineae bacterium UTCFX2]